MEIKVLGPGCAKCKRLEDAVKAAVRELELKASVTKVEDMMEIMNYGVTMTPALVVDGKVVLKGRIAGVKEVKDLLTKQF